MTDGYAGNQEYGDAGSEYGALQFVVRSIMGRMSTAMPVKVVAVTNDGDVSPVGVVDVQPMVAMLDGKGQPTPHGIIHNVPYMRIQGGQNAVIMDPAVGDIGLAIFASHDISSVKANKAPSNPGSRRRFSMADALYLGGFLNAAPERYIRFKADGDIELKPAAKVFVLGDIEATGDVKAGTVSLLDHVHSGVQTGGGESGPPVP